MKKTISFVCLMVLSIVSCFGFAGCGQKNKIIIHPDKEEYTVGIVQLVTHDALDAATKGFKDALTEELAKEGKTVKFKEQNAAGDSTTCTTIANNFVAKKVDLIMANATAALQASANATLNIPILGTSITEYGVALDLKNFDGVIGNNVSGTSDLAPLAEQAEMMRTLMPERKKIALLYCSGEPNSDYQVKAVKAELEKQEGYQCKTFSFTDSNDISSIVNGIVSEGYEAVYIPTDNTAASNSAVIDSILRPARIPVFAGEEGICKGCGFATLSISYYNIGKKTGEMAAEVLLGKTDITKLAIQYDEAPVKKYHAARCSAFGITIPEGYVAIEE